MKASQEDGGELKDTKSQKDLGHICRWKGNTMGGLRQCQHHPLAHCDI